MTGDERPPANWRRFSEAASLLPRLVNGFGHLGPRGPVDGPPALVIPGFIANDRTTMELRRALAAGGWRVHPWEMGMNMGAKADTLTRLEERLDELGKRPLLVVGWSLGGVYARELARAVPHRVRAVVTLGSPFSGDPKANNVWRLYEAIAGHKVDDPPLARIAAKPPVPALAIWSRRDGIVAPAAARGLPGESDRAVEFDCNHMSFGVSRRVLKGVVAEIGRFVEDFEGDSRG